MTIGLVDNDILLKLTAFQLFDETIDSLNLNYSNVQVLPTAKFIFRSKRERRQRYPDEVWANAIALVDRCQPVPEPNLEEVEALTEVQQLEPFRNQIHAGEATLILATRTTANFLLLSGDKSCLTALPQIPAKIYDRLCGRVICLEQLILKLIDELGFEKVSDLIRPTAQYDKAIQICFGYSQPSPEADVREALLSYINNMEELTPKLLMNLH